MIAATAIIESGAGIVAVIDANWILIPDLMGNTVEFRSRIDPARHFIRSLDEMAMALRDVG